MPKCALKTEVYSRVCGYHRPVSNWNEGKREEFKDRKTFKIAGRAEPRRDGVQVLPPVLAVVERRPVDAQAAD